MKNNNRNRFVVYPQTVCIRIKKKVEYILDLFCLTLNIFLMLQVEIYALLPPPRLQFHSL